MKLTNNKNYPDAILKAISNDPYNKGECDFSVTELLKPPRQRALQIQHKDEIEEDVESRLYALYGQITHLILERANVKDLAEERLFGKIGEYTVSGQIDSLTIEEGTLLDFKFTTAWGFMKNRPPKPEYVAQLNMQLELLRQNGLDASKLEIIGLLRDHQKSKAKTDKNYPQEPIARQVIEIWPREQTVLFMQERIEAHKNAEKELPKCNAEMTWGGRRCQDYCSAVKFCTQYQKAKTTGLLED